MRRFVLLVLAGTLYGTLLLAQPPGLAPVHPDETVVQTFDERFSLANALDRMAFVRGALGSFVKLTQACREKVPPSKNEMIGNTNLETQHLGFSNATGAIEGALRRQDWTIKRLALDLALERQKAGVTGDEDVARAQAAFDEADQSFREFWKGFGIAD